MRRWRWVPAAIGLACGLGFAVRFALLGGVDPRGQALALGAAALLLMYAWLDRDAVAEVGRAPTTRYALGSVGVVGVACVAAVAVYSGVRKVDRAWDLSQGSSMGLSDRGRAIAAGLDADVTVYALFRHGSATGRDVGRLLEELDAAGPRLTVVRADPLREPRLAERLGVTVETGAVVFEAGERRESLSARLDEGAVLDALVRITATRDRVVCWSEGHGEASPDADADRAAMSAAVLALEGGDVVVEPVNLLRGGVDPRCEALVIAGPRLDWLGVSRDALAAWVAGGGRALLMLDPGAAPELAADLSRYGLALGPDVVLEPDPGRRPPRVDDPSLLMLGPRDRGAHPVVDGLAGAVLLPVARSVRPEAATDGLMVRGVLFAGPDSYAELGEGEVGQRERVPVAAVVEVRDPAVLSVPDAPMDVSAELRARVVSLVASLAGRPVDGSSTLAALGLSAADRRVLAELLAEELGLALSARSTAEGVVLDALIAEVEAQVGLRAALASEGGAPIDPPPAQPGGRLIVIGDSQFAANGFIGFGSNRDLFVNAVRWLLDDETVLAAGPQAEPDLLEVTALGQGLLCVATTVLWPGVLLLWAVAAWWRRRS